MWLLCSLSPLFCLLKVHVSVMPRRPWSSWRLMLANRQPCSYPMIGAAGQGALSLLPLADDPASLSGLGVCWPRFLALPAYPIRAAAPRPVILEEAEPVS